MYNFSNEEVTRLYSRLIDIENKILDSVNELFRQFEQRITKLEMEDGGGHAKILATQIRELSLHIKKLEESPVERLKKRIFK